MRLISAGSRAGIGRVAGALALLLLPVVGWSYWRRPDGWAAFTVWPAWFWCLIGLTLACVGLAGRRRVLPISLIAMWLGVSGALVEELASLARALPHPPLSFEHLREQHRGLRVVCLNCSGQPAAAEEVRAYAPDIVLLTESPAPRHVQELARRLFGPTGGCVTGRDASIIAATLEPGRQERYFSSARVTVPGFPAIEVVSLRLPPAPVSLAIWSPGCWREHAADRRERWRTLQAIRQQWPPVGTTSPVIVGGDFNAPAGDGVLRLLGPDLQDSFRQGGRGWGDTLLNEFPVIRIDQVWINAALRAVSVTAHRTQHTDHRLVVADLALRSGP